MSSDHKTEIRTSNFASRMLSKALSERPKPTAKEESLTTADAAKYAVESEVKEPAVAVKV